ncbi:ABC transporter permease [Clostridium sp. cel8]|jgi:spermidine/putrescine transport system permease protein|uniref:ABC transporter permease n=1 Tax=unclassified Clostridium TaxID=2614128 RepID=UPI0015F65E8D|nr:ABC transporter permease [Clostridium sp. cel8]MBA5850314.1 ABC transporter permease [Clostridium sp. cel8]
MRKKNNILPTTITVGPTILWISLFIFIPMAYVFIMSFMEKGIYGGIVAKFTLKNYSDLLNPLYVNIYGRSIYIAFITTIICLIFGYPFAYIICNSSKAMKAILVTLIMLPFWINSLIRTYGWNALLRTEGIINTILLKVGIIDHPLTMLYTSGAVLLGMVYTLFPFMVLPLYASIEKLDKSLIEASSDLGASPIRIFFRVILPLTMPGIFAGSIQVFIPTLGYFFISDMMGGGKDILIGNLIKNQFLSARNWPLGAALSVLLIVLTIVLIKLYSKIGKVEDMV